MDKDKLKQIVNDTLGFNPEEFAYKLQELEADLNEIKKSLGSVLPIIGSHLVEYTVLKGHLSKVLTEPELDKILEDGMKNYMKQNSKAIESDVKKSSKKKTAIENKLRKSEPKEMH